MSIDLNGLQPTNGIKRSEKDSKIDVKLMVSVFFLLGISAFAVYAFLNSSDVLGAVEDMNLQRMAPTLTVASAETPLALGMESTPTPDPTATATTVFPTLVPTVMDVAATVQAVLVQNQVLQAAQQPAVIRDIQEVEIEVTRIVTQTVVQLVDVPIQPTPTPSMLPGVVRLCIYGEGFTAIYIDGIGKPGNSCFDYAIVSPTSNFAITVTK